MAAVVTAEQRKQFPEWAAAKDAENAGGDTAAQMAAGSAVSTPTAGSAGTVPMAGPIMPGATRPNVPVTPVSATKTADPLNGTLQGPYESPNGGYQAGLKIVNGVPQYDQPQQTAQPISAQQSQPTQTAPDYAALAAARTAAALAQKRTIAEQQKSSLDRSYARSNEITQDNRTLENGQINRTLNPFSGKTAFDKGIIGRERALVDETSAGNLQAQKSNIDQLLADYENATAEEQVRIADELQRADRAYNLDLAKFNQDQSNFDKTFGQNQQQIDYSQNPNNPANQGQVLQNQGQAQQNLLNQYKIDDYPAEQKANATKIQQELETGKMNLEAAKYNFEQLKDPNSTYNQAAKIDLALKQLDLKNAPEKDRLEMQQLQKQIAQIGVVHYKPQTDAEIAQDKVTLATATKQLADIQNGIYPGDKSNQPQTAETYSKYLDSVAQYTKDPDTGASVLSNPDAVESAILTSGMSEYEMFRSYKAKGLPWSGPIPSAPGK